MKTIVQSISALTLVLVSAVAAADCAVSPPEDLGGGQTTVRCDDADSSSTGEATGSSSAVNGSIAADLLSGSRATARLHFESGGIVPGCTIEDESENDGAEFSGFIEECAGAAKISLVVID